MRLSKCSRDLDKVSWDVLPLRELMGPSLLNLIDILGAGGRGACSRLPQQKEAKGSCYCQLNDVGD